MLMKNPFRHYPRYVIRVIRVDGKICGVSGNAEVDVIGVPGEEEEIITVILTALDAGNNPVITKMLIDDLWHDYDEKLLDQLKRDAQVKDSEAVEEDSEAVEEDSEAVEEEHSSWRDYNNIKSDEDA